MSLTVSNNILLLFFIVFRSGYYLSQAHPKSLKEDRVGRMFADNRMKSNKSPKENTILIPVLIYDHSNY